MPAETTSSSASPSDPDMLVFWLTSSLCALFLLFVPGVAPPL